MHELTVLHFRKNRTCRICTKRSNFVINIFDGPSESGLSNVDVVSHYTGLPVRRGDSLPETVCSLCLVDARIAFRSKSSSRESDQLDIQAMEENLEKLGADIMKEVTGFCEERPIKKDVLEIRENEVKKEPLEDAECISPDYSGTTPLQHRVKEEPIEDKFLSGEQIDSKTTFHCDSALDTHLQTHESFPTKHTSSTQSPLKGMPPYKCQKRSPPKVFFRCSFCMMCFKQQSDLDLHMLGHSGERFTCTVCSESFAFENDLKRHMRSHNTNLIKCPKCPRLFQHKTGLKNHVLKHGFKFLTP